MTRISDVVQTAITPTRIYESGTLFAKRYLTPSTLVEIWKVDGSLRAARRTEQGLAPLILQNLPPEKESKLILKSPWHLEGQTVSIGGLPGGGKAMKHTEEKTYLKIDSILEWSAELELHKDSTSTGIGFLFRRMYEEMGEKVFELRFTFRSAQDVRLFVESYKTFKFSKLHLTVNCSDKDLALFTRNLSKFSSLTTLQLDTYSGFSAAAAKDLRCGLLTGYVTELHLINPGSNALATLFAAPFGRFVSGDKEMRKSLLTSLSIFSPRDDDIRTLAEFLPRSNLSSLTLSSSEEGLSIGATLSPAIEKSPLMKFSIVGKESSLTPEAKKRMEGNRGKYDVIAADIREGRIPTDQQLNETPCILESEYSLLYRACYARNLTAIEKIWRICPVDPHRSYQRSAYGKALKNRYKDIAGWFEREQGNRPWASEEFLKALENLPPPNKGPAPATFPVQQSTPAVQPAVQTDSKIGSLSAQSSLTESPPASVQSTQSSVQASPTQSVTEPVKIVNSIPAQSTSVDSRPTSVHSMPSPTPQVQPTVIQSMPEAKVQPQPPVKYAQSQPVVSLKHETPVSEPAPINRPTSVPNMNSVKARPGSKKPRPMSQRIPAHLQITGIRIVDYETLELEEELGRGGFGTVHKAQWLNQTVAYKEMKGSFSQHKMEAFKKECELLDTFRCNYIVGLFAITVEPMGMVMEYMDGGSLRTRLKNLSGTSWPQRYKWAQDIAIAIQFLHQSNVYHRDLKADNVLLTNGGKSAKLADLGLSRENDDNSNSLKGMAGTFPWMDPQLLSHDYKYSDKSDIYSFGVTLWEIATGKQPFQNVEVKQLIPHQVLNGLTLDIADNIPEDCANLIRICCKVQPADRPTIDVVVTKLAKMLKDSTVYGGQQTKPTSPTAHPQVNLKPIQAIHQSVPHSGYVMQSAQPTPMAGPTSGYMMHSAQPAQMPGPQSGYMIHSTQPAPMAMANTSGYVIQSSQPTPVASQPGYVMHSTQAAPMASQPGYVMHSTQPSPMASQSGYVMQSSQPESMHAPATAYVSHSTPPASMGPQSGYVVQHSVTPHSGYAMHSNQPQPMHSYGQPSGYAMHSIPAAESESVQSGYASHSIPAAYPSVQPQGQSYYDPNAYPPNSSYSSYQNYSTPDNASIYASAPANSYPSVHPTAQAQPSVLSGYLSNNSGYYPPQSVQSPQSQQPQGYYQNDQGNYSR